MKHKYLASSDLTLETTSGNINYSKGDLVDLRVNPSDQRPYILNHTLVAKEAKEGDKGFLEDGKEGVLVKDGDKLVCKIGEAIYKKFTTLGQVVESRVIVVAVEESLRTLLGGVILSEELDSKLDNQKIEISELVISENVSVAALSRYVAESFTAKDTSPNTLTEALKGMPVVEGTKISVPVYRRTKKENLQGRARALGENLYEAKKGDHKFIRLQGVVVAENSIDKTGYLVAKDKISQALATERSESPLFKSFFYTSPDIDWSKAKFTEDFTISDEVKALSEEDTEGAVCTTADGMHGFMAQKDGAWVCVADPAAVLPLDGKPNPMPATDIGNAAPPMPAGVSPNAPAVSDPSTGMTGVNPPGPVS